MNNNELKNQSILFVLRGVQYAGTENIVLKLCSVFSQHAKKIVVASANALDDKKLDQIGVKIYHIPDIERKSIRNALIIYKVLSNIIATENITIVHTHHRMAAFYARLLLRKFKFIFINTSHNTFYNKKLLTRFCYRKAHLIACGEMVKKNLTDFFDLPEKQIEVIFNAVESFDSGVVDDPALKNLKMLGYKLVGNVGRLSEQKGMEYFIRSYPLVKASCQNVKFIIVGEGEKKTELVNEVKKINAEQDILFLGYRCDIQNIMSQLDVVVLSSLWEGLPLTPIEAFSVHKPVIATNVDGTPEIVLNKFNGLLVEPQNVSQLAEAIKKILSNMNIYETYAENAYKTYLEKFSIVCFERNYLSKYIFYINEKKLEQHGG